MRPHHFTALLVSVALHAAIATPVYVGRKAAHPDAPPAMALDHAVGEDEQEGEQPIEELENRPFRVSLYVEPAPVAAAPAPEAPVAASVTPAAPVEASEPVVPLPVPQAPEPQPVAEAPAPPVERELTEAEKAALAAMEQGEATDGDALADADLDEVEGAEVVEPAPAPVAKEKKPRSARRVRTRTEKDRRPPCPDPVEDIARVADAHWYIDRDLIEHYATNLVELQKLGSVWTHRGADGKLDGFRVGLARCSILRQGGLRSGDIVHDINGRRINTVLQAVGAYFALRNEPELRVNITRRGEPLLLGYTIEQPERKRGKKKKSETASR